MSDTVIWIIVILIFALMVGLSVFFGLSPKGMEIWREMHGMPAHPDVITDETRKATEDYCRALIASWEEDAEVYRQYKDSEDDEGREKAEQAKLSANKTAERYNEYMLMNAYVWGEHLPDGIYAMIEAID
ncbi:MAG: hypothetical protein J6W04_00755 [Bacteroidales bacterium]|nr:hypothetical protein [Bacteroidales bacterium]